MRMSGAVWQPCVVAAPTVDEQFSVRPGTLPAAAVTSNDDSGSNAIPYPARITIFWLLPGDQVTPIRGANASMLLFLNHRSAWTKVTALPSLMELFGTYTRPPDSDGAVLISHRMP